MQIGKKIESPQFPEGLTKQEILKQVPELPKGSFSHWVFLKAKIRPIGEKRIGYAIADIFPPDSVEKIKMVLASRKMGFKQ
jgi:hypothetical protein